MKIKFLLLLSVALLVSASTALAQVSVPMLVSKEKMLAFAVQHAVTVQMYLSSASQVGSSLEYGYSVPSNHTRGDIMRLFTNAVPAITFINPNDPVYMNGAVVNSEGETLLTASAANYPYFGPGGYSIPLDLVVRLNTSQAIRFDKPLASAEVIEIDPITGQTVSTQWFYVNGNKLYFNPDYAGRGILVVTFKDGTTKSYDLRNGGTQVQSQQAVGRITSATLEGMPPTYYDPTNVIDVIPANNSIGINRTYEIVMTKTNLVFFSVKTSEGYSPIRVNYSQSPTPDNWLHIDQPAGVQYVPLQLTPGTWYVYPDWDPNQFQDQDPAYWWYYGGKG